MTENKIKWVHCNSHGRPHYVDENGHCWCGCIDDAPDFGRDATPLRATTDEEAYAECEARGLWLYKWSPTR